MIQAHRLYLVELMQQWTRLKEGEARDDLGLALVVDAELFRLGPPRSPLRVRSFAGWGRGDEHAAAARRVQDLRPGAGHDARARRVDLSRRLRALGMLSAIGATERNLRLVMIASGLAVGAAATLAGAVLGFAAWFAYAPALQQATGHVVDAANLPWWAFAIGAVFANATSVLAARRRPRRWPRCRWWPRCPAAPLRPKAAHRSAVPGVIAFAIGVAGLATAGGLAGAGGNGGSPALHLLGGLVAMIVGIVLLAPLAISMLRASSRLPVAIRIALRALVRYRAQSGAALAAVTFAVFLAMAICLVASTKFDNPLDWIGPTCPAGHGRPRSRCGAGRRRGRGR